MICLPIRFWYAHSLVLKPSEKYMLLVKQLYGRNADGAHHNVDVGKDVGENKLFAESAINSAKERRWKILSLLRLNPTISAHEIALVLNVSTRTIERDLEWLKKAGAIMRDGADCGGKWVVLHNENLNT